ncbi:hypothetical protein [Mesonia aestuariivivens]|uniref:DUF4231 domain-containing protein n=1 Tax=Mesonia aestuariivivens TaxID=2796128 RepID=A0ABS6W5F4_9FLAO|nr:hypothetical protein [Mesonia aestuariivivens]MBW2963102.1 hypothetical protein [Mesonia aestuariivivens]
MAKIDQYQKYRAQRNKRLLLAFLASICLIIGLLFFITTSYFMELFLISNRTIIILGAFLFIVGLALLFSVYLGLQPLRIYRPFDEYENFDLNSIFNYHLKKNFIDKYGSQYRRYDKPEEEPILFVDELESFKRKYVEQAQHDLEYANLFDDLNKLEGKFRTQIERLVSNSNLNLIIGIITTLIAVVILGFSIFQDRSFKTNTDFFSFFLPRISTVIFVELFSFFFLRLYKNNLEEIKYFQNEITNLNFKITSLKTALKMEDKDSLSKIIINFSLAERNNILKKGETTERIESNRMESGHISNLSKSFSELIEKLK